MTDADFEFIAKLLKEQSGLIITKDKGYLLESRLMPVARSNNFVTLEDLFMALRNKQPALISQVVEAMTTNESFFFRDIKPFEQFEKIVVPYLIKKKAATKSIRIWSAACSSGQEVYSLCMILRDKFPELATWKIELVATDLSLEILNKAMAGVYSQFEVQRGLPIQYLVKYFKKEGENWLIDKSLVSMVQFKKWNLLNELKSLGNFDVVFCRNVLIYFDQPTKTSILNKISDLMPKDGFLYLGGAETVLGICDNFRPIAGHRGIYTGNFPESASIDAFIKGEDISKIQKPATAFPSSTISPSRPLDNKSQTASVTNIQKTPMPQGTPMKTDNISKGLSDAMASLRTIVNKTEPAKPATSTVSQTTTVNKPSVSPSAQQPPKPVASTNNTGSQATTKVQSAANSVSAIFAALRAKQQANVNNNNQSPPTQNTDKK